MKVTIWIDVCAKEAYPRVYFMGYDIDGQAVFPAQNQQLLGDRFKIEFECNQVVPNNPIIYQELKAQPLSEPKGE